MQIEEKQIVTKGQNIILRSPKRQDAKSFSEVRDITYRETYFLARYPEETDFTAEAAEAMISDISERREEFLIGAFYKDQREITSNSGIRRESGFLSSKSTVEWDLEGS